LGHVFHSVLTVRRDPLVFPDPEDFKLERSQLSQWRSDVRWMGLSREEESKLIERTMIFGYGPRICIGKEYMVSGVAWADFRMAMMELRLLLSALILKYETWSGVPDKPGKWDEEMKP